MFWIFVVTAFINHMSCTLQLKMHFFWLEHPIEQVHLCMMAAAEFQRHGILTNVTEDKISNIFRNSLHRKCKPIDDRFLEILRIAL